MPKIQKILFLSIALMFSMSNYAQVVNYNFIQPLPPGDNNILSIPPKLIGEYASDSSNQKIVVKARGIFMESNVYGSISREEIRENSKYEVRNDHIFGVSDHDSLPCILEGENYFFGIRKTTELFSFNGTNTLRKWDPDKMDHDYILCYPENGYWLPMLLSFSGNKLIISNPSFDDVKEAFSTIIDKFTEEGEGVTHIHLHPSSEEWSRIDLKTYFIHQTVYTRE